MSNVKRVVFFSIIAILSIAFSVQAQQAPKNIILLISDGWGYNHITATNYYEYGMDKVQVYEGFPLKSAMSTYQARNKSGVNPGAFEGRYEPDRAWVEFDYVTKKPTDSAASATAMSTGVKTYNGAIDVDCNQNPLETIVQRAEKLGKATGVVTSVEWTHATPAGMVAHNISRNNYAEIGVEMIYNSGLDVIMGCGHPMYDDNAHPVTTPNTYKYVGGESTWNELVNGSAGNDADGDGTFDRWTLIQSKEDFLKLMNGETPKRLIGIPTVYQTLQCNRIGDTSSQDITSAPYSDTLNQGVPTLAEMTSCALNVLDNNSNGFFLMVEGGAVDWASHANSTARMIEEQIDFNRSVEAVVRWVTMNSNWDETMVIVTGDHECGYLAGPGSDPTWMPVENNGAGVLPGTEWHSGDHTNSLIPIYAKGNGAAKLLQHADEFDSERGYYLTNSEIGQTMLSLWPDPAKAPQIPKNIFLLISDGCGYNHIFATDYYETGRIGDQVYEKFPVQYAMSTFQARDSNGNNPGPVEGAYAPDCAWNDFNYVNLKPTDSAASATAFATGMKTYNGAICMDAYQHLQENIVQLAEKKGKATGVVTSVEWSHATPAAMVAHNVTRNNYEEIAREMIYNSGLDVIMGCGHPWYGHDAQPLEQPNTYKYIGGESTWNDLKAGKAGNDADGDGIFDAWTLIEDSLDFVRFSNGDTPKRLVGIPKVYQTLQSSRSGATSGNDNTSAPYTDKLNAGLPTLAQMTEAAINVLDNDQDGFFLMVEGGAIDWASHANSTARTIEEEIDFNDMVESVVRWVNENSNWSETLVIVTGDHECGYLTGPDSDPTWEPVLNSGAGNLPGTEWHSGDHTNALIPLYANGAGSEFFKLYADQVDSVRGSFVDNAEVGQLMISLMEMNPVGGYIVENSYFQIVSVSDVPNDQGRQVRVTWDRHPEDKQGGIQSYSVYRKIDYSLRKALGKAAIPDGDWEFVADVPAIQTPRYSVIVPTLADSCEKYGDYKTYFYVMAHSVIPGVNYASEEAYGMSIDNLGPPTIEIVIVYPYSGGYKLSWAKSEAEDFSHFEIYRGETADFEISEENLVAKTTETYYEDGSPECAGKACFYKLAVCDANGNKNISTIKATLDGELAPKSFALKQNFPNPFNPQTQIEYSIPAAGKVTLKIYDMLGREVATLVDGHAEAGIYKSVWNAKNFGSGTYFYKLHFGNQVITKKMTLIK